MADWCPLAIGPSVSSTDSQPSGGSSRPGAPRSAPTPGTAIEPDADERTAERWGVDRRGHLWEKDRETTSADGTRIRYTVRGADTGPWIVLCPGFVCPDNFWMWLGPALMERYRVVILNYRGVGASEHAREVGWRARNVEPGDYTIGRLAEDVLAVAEAEGAHDVTLLGHSMGCQVALEVWRQDPDRVASLVMVTGPYQSPLRTFYGTQAGAHLFPLIYLGLPLLPRPLQWLIVQTLHLPITMPMARAVRALGPLTPEEGMKPYFEHFARLDPIVVMAIARGMHEFDAGPWLHELDVPALIVVGTADTFTPPELGDLMYETIPGSELVLVEEGTHGAIIEFPDELHDVIADFLHRRLDHPPAEPRARADVMLEHRKP